MWTTMRMRELSGRSHWACDDRFAHGGRISAVRDAACISYRDYGSDSEGPDNEIVGKGYRRLLEKEFQPYECTAPAL